MAEDFKKVLTDSLKDGQRVIRVGAKRVSLKSLTFAINVLQFLMVEIMFSQGI